jgi:hypothetical protein
MQRSRYSAKPGIFATSPSIAHAKVAHGERYFGPPPVAVRRMAPHRHLPKVKIRTGCFATLSGDPLDLKPAASNANRCCGRLVAGQPPIVLLVVQLALARIQQGSKARDMLPLECCTLDLVRNQPIGSFCLFVSLDGGLVALLALPRRRCNEGVGGVGCEVGRSLGSGQHQRIQ